MASVFGNELESVKCLLEKEPKVNQECDTRHDIKWIRAQMARSRYDVEMAISPSISKRGFLEKTDINILTNSDQY